MRIAGRLAAFVVVTALLAVGGGTASAGQARAGTPAMSGRGPVGVRSRWAELANAATGAGLWSRSPRAERPIGSIAKVMTAYVVLTTPGVSLSRLVTVPSGVVAYDREYRASTAGLNPGEKYSTAQLLYALLLPSGCDAAYALAYAYGPGLAGFVGRMNAAASRLGLTRTHFTDFSGLPDPTEYSTYSTAHDLISLGRDAMARKPFAAIVATRQYTVAAASTHPRHVWRNLNPLLGTFPGAAGIKTGYTAAAGQCLLFEARRGSTTLIGVVLDSAPVNSASLTAAASDAAAMLDWGLPGRPVQ